MRSLALLALALLSGQAAALEKCVDANGRISYLDICPTTSTRTPSKTDESLLPKPSGTLPRKPPPKEEPVIPNAIVIETKPAPKPAAPPGAAQDIRLEYYDVQASDYRSALAALQQRGGAQAESSWKLSYQYRVREGGGRCAIESVGTQLELGIRLPRWSAEAPGGPDAERWARYVGALREHEERRLENARAFEKDLAAALKALPAQETCGALEGAMRARYEALNEEAKLRFAEYDTRFPFDPLK